MTPDIRVYTVEMPARVKSYTVEKDGYYTIIINSILAREQQLKEYEHEHDHIIRGDFDRSCSADLIEFHAHRRI